MVFAQQILVILSLSKDLGSAKKENSQRLSNCFAKILRLRTSCSAQNDKLRKLLTPHSSLLTEKRNRTAATIVCGAVLFIPPVWFIRFFPPWGG